MTTTGINQGDTLRAEKIIITALKITIAKKPFRRTSGHNAQRATAERNVECTIVKKMTLAKNRP